VRIGDAITENRRAFAPLHGGAELRIEILAVEDVVAQDQADIAVADKLLADDEGLGQALGPGLLGIGERDAEAAAIAEQFLEQRTVFGRGDDQHVVDACEHQHRQRIIDHRLVIDRQELLRDALGQRIQARTRSSGQDDAFGA